MFTRMFLSAALFVTTACSPVENTADGAAQTSSSSSNSSTTTTTVTGANGTSVSTSTRDGYGAGNSSSSSATSVSAGGGMALSEANDLYEFDYSWPGAAAAIPGLSGELQKRMERAKTSLVADAREGRAAAQGDYALPPHSSSWEWKVAADTPRFLTLTADVANYMGGAHGIYGKDVLVWDRKGSIARDSMAFFASPAALDRAIAPRYCRELDRQREQRRGMEVNDNSPFGECPSVEDLEVIFGSTDSKAFDRIGFYASPYVAGAYVEGEYEVTLPVDNAILGALKPEYRRYFSGSQ